MTFSLLQSAGLPCSTGRINNLYMVLLPVPKAASAVSAATTTDSPVDFIASGIDWCSMLITLLLSALP